MEAGGFNQKSLARAAGLNQTAVRDILIGKSRHPRHDTLEKLAASLECSVIDLLEPGRGGGKGGGQSRSQATRQGAARGLRATRERAPAAATELALDDELAFVATYEVAAGAGEGIVIDGEHIRGRLAFRRDWLRGVTAAGPEDLAVIAVRGDSMYPTLADGDTILVDLTQRAPVRDGVYIIRFGEFVLVKRLHIDPVRRRVTISCDNENYPPLSPVDPGDVDVAGRGIWVGRRL